MNERTEAASLMKLDTQLAAARKWEKKITPYSVEPSSMSNSNASASASIKSSLGRLVGVNQ
jgi:hypothetical protein